MCKFQEFLRDGFLPSQLPLQSLPPKFAEWEALLESAKWAIANFKRKDTLGSFMRRWRASIRKMDIIECDLSEGDESITQRAHHVLTFLTQYYVQSRPTDLKRQTHPIRIPAPLAVPLVAVSRKLGIAPIVTYADTVLWNWTLIDPDQPLSCHNVRIIDLFTGDEQEEHFFLTSLRIEISGKPSLRLMSQFAASGADGERPLSRLAEDLEVLAQNIREVTRIFRNVRGGLDPGFFYNIFRPWIQGADQGPDSPPWYYEGVDQGEGLLLQPSGPSAGQSALMHSFDVFLGVVHPHRGLNPSQGCMHAIAALDPHGQTRDCSSRAYSVEKCPPLSQRCFKHGSRCSEPVPTLQSPSEAIHRSHQIQTPEMPAPQEVDTSFNARMRSYMPLEHQEFLLWLERNNIQKVIWGLSDSIEATTAPPFYRNLNGAIEALREWRDAHIQIVTQYVIIPGRQRLAKLRSSGVATGSVDENHSKTEVVRGTGGTALIPLLKIYRDNTKLGAFHPLGPLTPPRARVLIE